MTEIEKAEENIQQDFAIHEAEEIKRVEEETVQWFGESNLPLKQRIYQFIATIVVVLAKNFMGKIKWQIGLVLGLAIIVPVGTWTTIKWILNLFR